MTLKKRIRPVGRTGKRAETIEDLAKIAFGNMADFCRFGADGRVHVLDWAKASEVGAQLR